MSNFIVGVIGFVLLGLLLSGFLCFCINFTFKKTAESFEDAVIKGSKKW